MKSMKFGKGQTMERTLEIAKVGDEIAILDSAGNFLRMDKVTKRTPKSVWTGKTALQARFSFDGLCLNGRGTARIPTHNDVKSWRKKKADLAKWQLEQKRLEGVRATEEYSSARNIGYHLCDGPLTSDPDQYLAFVKLIGLKALQAFEKLVDDAVAKASAPELAQRRPRNKAVRRLRDVDASVQPLPVS